MRQVHLDGQVIEISEQEFLILLEGVASGIYTYVENYCRFHVSGFPDVMCKWEPWIQKGQDQLQTLIPQIDDEQLRELFQSLDSQARRIGETDKQLAKVIASFFDLSAPQTKQERQKLGRKVNKYATTGELGWATQQEYHQLVEQSQQILTNVDKIKRQIDNRLTELGLIPSPISEDTTPSITAMDKQTRDIPSTPLVKAISDKEFGDQRAKDLIDETEGELDPRSAIKLLHKALRFGKTGIQASKAYISLAIRYEELDDITRAIKYYTKAMEAWHPSAFMFFWRGQLYYQRKQWGKARNDFEQALAFPLTESLTSPERELAEKYLLELNKSFGN